MKALRTGMTVLMCPSLPASDAICLDVLRVCECWNLDMVSRAEVALFEGMEGTIGRVNVHTQKGH